MYSKTEAGQQAFKARSNLFSARQRSAFILFDGVKSTSQVLEATSGIGISLADIEHMVQQGFLLSATGATLSGVMDGTEVVPPSEPVMATRSPQERYSDAMPIATKLTASLGLRGFRLNLAVESASGFEDLLALLPKIQDAVGTKPCAALAKALKA